MRIETDRFLLRPLLTSDTGTLARIVFSDPLVTGNLAHDVRNEADALKEAARWTREMGHDGDGSIWDDGGVGLFAITAKGEPETVIGTAGFYMERDGARNWSGEYFYALGRNWHFKGVMSELAPQFRILMETLPDIALIYGVYWDSTNKASGRILEKSGLAPAGRVPVAHEYSVEKCRRIFVYDVWRVGNAQGSANLPTILLQSCRRAGAFVAEGMLAEAEAMPALEAALASPLSEDARTIYQFALDNPGMAYVEYRRPGASPTTVSRLA